MPPNLSIIIPCHNRPDLLRTCLASVCRHAPTRTEIIVVDDASPGTVASEVAAAFPNVRAVALPVQCGFCAAANAGIRAADGQIVEMLNDDTEVTPGWAEAALAAFADPEIAAVAPLVLYHPAGDRESLRVDSAGDRYYLGGVAGKRGHGEALRPDHTRPGRVFGASASSAFYRRDAVVTVGGFPESFGAYFEDIDLAFRLQRAGWRAQFEPGSVVYHRVSASHRPCRRLLEQQSRNEERVFWRNVPSAELRGALPRHLAVLAAKAWRRWQEGCLTPFLSGRLRVIGDIGALRRHRRWLDRLGPADVDAWGVERNFWNKPPSVA